MGVSLGALKSKQINRVLKCCRRCAGSLVAWTMNVAVWRHTQRENYGRKISYISHKVLWEKERFNLIFKRLEVIFVVVALRTP